MCGLGCLLCPWVAARFLVGAWGMLSNFGLRVKMCVWLGVSRGLDLAFLNAD